MPKPKEIARKQVTSLGAFQNKLPVIRALCTEGLKEDHIAKMAKRLNMVGTDITKVPVGTLEEPEKQEKTFDPDDDDSYFSEEDEMD